MTDREQTTAHLLTQGIELIRTALDYALVEGPIIILVPPGGRRAIEARLSWELHGLFKHDQVYAEGRLMIVGVEVRDA